MRLTLSRTVISAGIVCALCQIGTPKASAAPYTTRQIDDAVSTSLIDFAYGVSGNQWGNDSLHRSAVMYFLATAAHWDKVNSSTTTASSGTTVKARLLAQLRNLLVTTSTSSNEPLCAGGIYGWADGPVALSIALAKFDNDAAVWGQLTPDEKTRFDWMMKALAVAGHWSMDDGNNYKTFLNNQAPTNGLIQFEKNWNPNHWNGQIAALIAARSYFGQTNFDAIFTNFRKQDYLNAFSAYGWKNIVWNVSTEIMETGVGTDACGGSGAGIRGNFHQYTSANTASNWLNVTRSLNVPFDYFQLALENFCRWTAADSLENNSLYLLTGASPKAGQNHMFYEFKAQDGGGTRSSPRYVYDGWRNILPTYAFLKLTGGWGTGTGQTDLENRINVGAEDLLYKYLHGYRGKSNSNTADFWQPAFNDMGYGFNRALWRQYVGPSSNHPARNNTAGIQGESFDVSGQTNGTTLEGKYGFVDTYVSSTRRAAGSIRNGDWAIYHDVNFDSWSTGATKFAINLGVATGLSSSPSVKVELSTTGTGGWYNLGTYTIPTANGINSYSWRQLALSSGYSGQFTGTKSVRLTFSGPAGVDLCNVDSFYFAP